MAQSLTTLQSAALGPVLTASGVAPTVSLTTTTYPNSATAADPAGGETITVTGTGFLSGVKIYVNSTICTTTYVSATSLTFVSPAMSTGSYVVYIVNTDGTSGVNPAGITYSAVPVWVTASGALTNATLNSAYSQSVSATGDTIVYSLTTGSLSTGLSLNTSTGAITGTPTASGTSNFTITATDAQNQKVPRNFSIAVLAGPATVDYLVVAGGAAGGYYGAGGGAGGLLYATAVSLPPAVTYTITVGAGGAATPGPSGGNGGNSSISGSGFTTVTAIGGGGGGGQGAVSGSGGSGGGASSWDNVKGKGVYPGSTYLSQARQGYDGGAYTGSGGGNERQGNGGGAGAQGADGSPTGTGGIGLQYSITGTATYYAGGGGGGGYSGNQQGGLGGGGKGGTYTVSPYTGGNGTTNTGGGGGGGSYNAAYKAGGAGGSGVVIIRTTSSASATTGSPTVTTDGSYNVYTFTGTGSITF